MFFGEFDRDMMLGRLDPDPLWKFLCDSRISSDRKVTLYFAKAESNSTMDKP